MAYPSEPEFGHGRSMAEGAPGIPCFVTGTVRSLDGKPVAGAVLDLWQTDGEGLYEEQRRTTEPWMRGIYKTQADGSYSVRTVAPISYTIPIDGPAGEFFNRTNMSHSRPAHIHFAVSALQTRDPGLLNKRSNRGPASAAATASSLEVMFNSRVRNGLQFRRFKAAAIGLPQNHLPP